MDGEKYTYTWDPTKPVPCAGNAGTYADVAVCQYAPGTGIAYNAGNLSPSFFRADFNFPVDATEGNWTVTYPDTPVPGQSGIDGEGIRISTFLFVITDDPGPPTIEMVGENPYTEYSFVVKGACIGQPAFDTCRPPAATSFEL